MASLACHSVCQHKVYMFASTSCNLKHLSSMAMTILQFVCGLTLPCAYRHTSPANAQKRSCQQDVQKQDQSAQAYRVPAQRLGLQGFLGWEAVSLAAQRMSLSTGSACFARKVLSWAHNVPSCFLAVQHPHAQRSHLGKA